MRKQMYSCELARVGSKASVPCLHQSPKAPLPRRALPWSQRVQRSALSLGAATLLLFSPNHAIAEELSTTQLFTRNCAGCHAGGGNIVQRNAGLSKEELQRNNAATPQQIYDLIYSGKGKMPGYGVNCAPRGKCTFTARLADGQITDLTDYVLSQASTGWKQ